MRLDVDPQAPDEGVVDRARAVIEAHGIVALPTETFYGLAVSAFDAAAVRRVFELKGRSGEKALPCIVADPEQLSRLAISIPRPVPPLARRFWPGPLTIVVPARTSVAAASPAGTVAVRVSGLPLARRLAAAAGPITATSANRSGAPAPTRAEAVQESFAGGLDLLLDGGETPGGAPSTIVDATGRDIVLVREGAIPFEAVRAALES